MTEDHHIEIKEVAPVWLVSVAARRGKRGQLVESIRDSFNLTLPQGPKAEGRDGITLIATGPESWLFICNDGTPSRNEILGSISETAAVCDQSGAYLIYDVSGHKASEWLQKSLFIDLDSSVFPPGTAATTTLSHLGVTLWRTDVNRFRIAVPRSYADALKHWVQLNGGRIGTTPRELG